MLTFTPLLGAQSESPASQSLLELDGGVKVLVDVGWDVTFDAEKLQELEKHVPTLSVILLTHPTLDHLGAYAHCCRHVPSFSKIPVYATTPVVNLGRTLLTDLYASSPLAASIIPATSITSPATAEPGLRPNLLLQPPTPDEISSYFSLINPLKYSQPHQPLPSPFSPPLGGLTVTAYSAGHTLGGTIWHIQHGLESIVYAADWNQSRENLLGGASWLSAGGTEIIEPLRRPTTLICSSKGVEKQNPLPRKKRDDTLVSLIRETIAQGGKVLLPTDSSARVLELAFLLNQTWRENVSGPHSSTYRNAKIYLASKTASSTVRYMQSMLEWMDDGVQQEADRAMTLKEGGRGKDQVDGPLEWKYVRAIEKQSQLERALARRKPSIILASDASADWGFSRLTLQSLAADAKNLVILPDKLPMLEGQGKASLGSSLWKCWQERSSQTSAQSGAKVVNTDGLTVELQVASATQLEGYEATLYRQYLARQRQLHSTQQGDNTAGPDAAADLVDDQASESSESSDEDEDTEHQGKALNLSNQLTQSNKRKVGLTDAELGINVLLRGKNVHDYDVRNKRGREKMFPFLAHRQRNDEFGDLIKPEDYLRAEERDEIDGMDMRDGVKQETAVGQKRKWDDVASSGPKARRNSKPQNKKPKVHTKLSEPDDIDAKIAAITGGAAPDLAQPNGADEESSESEESDYEPEEAAVEGPQKVVFSRQTLQLNLRIAHVDFAGLHEKRDLQMIIPLIRPRKLILIAGEASETQMLAEECRQLLSRGEGEAEVFAPSVGETVDASVDTNAWSLKLTRQLVKKLTWQNVKGLGVVALTGHLNLEPAEETVQDKAEDENAKKKLKLIKPDEADTAVKDATKSEKQAIPVLDLLGTPATNSAATQRVTQPVHVGDLRIADLRNLLRASNHQAEFRGEGTLLVDGSVVVRKGAGGRIEVEAGGGGLAKPQYHTMENEGTFYAVKKLIYSGLAVVAGV